MAKVPTDGQFGRAMADGVYEFQRRHHLPVTGMIGGGSWPLLAVPVKAGQGGNAELAVQVLTRARSRPRSTRRSGSGCSPGRRRCECVRGPRGCRRRPGSRSRPSRRQYPRSDSGPRRRTG
jgi:hypothetical protein